MATKYKGKSHLSAVHLWWKESPQNVKVIPKEFEDIFPKDLLPGFLPNRMSMNSKSIPGMIRRQCIGPSTRSARSSWRKPETSLNICSSVDLIHHRIHPMEP